MYHMKKDEIYGSWKVLEPNIINPETKAKLYIGKPIFSKCICIKCNKTIRYIRNNDLAHIEGGCRSCAIIERNIQNREIVIGKKYGKLTVIKDGGYEVQSNGKRRHYSFCRCDCGNIVKIMDNSLQNGNVSSCGCLSSKGELLIQQILDNNNIIYNKDSVFPELAKETGRKLRFDFIIYNEDGTVNRFIEFDGVQHNSGMSGGIWSYLEPLEIIQERDNIKNNFCKQHGYTLVRLPYHTIKNLTIDKIMGDEYIYE